MIAGSLISFYLIWGSLGAVGLAPAETAAEFAANVRQFSFEEADDQDFDGQPDDWTRRQGPGFPQYVDASIDRTTGADGRQSLRFTVNGGGAVYYSPLIPVDAEHSYILDAQIRTEALRHDAALVSVSLLNHKRQRVRRYLSRAVAGTHRDWVRVEIQGIVPDARVRFIVIGCHLVQDEKLDIRGHVWFDDLKLAALPRLKLSMNSPTHFFQQEDPIRIAADIQGLDPQHDHQLLLRLENGAGQLLQNEKFSLPPLMPADPKPADPMLADPNAADPNAADSKPSESGAARRPPVIWNLPPQTNGTYRLWATLEQNGKFFLQEQASFAVMQAAQIDEASEFGWTVSRGPGTMPLGALADTAAEAGIRWLKLPLWSTADPQQEAKAVELAKLLAQLDRRGIAVVGLLNDPPRQLTRKFANNTVGVSKVFTLPPDVWYPSLEPVIARYSFHVRHWQLGDEADNSFVGLTTLPQTLSTVKREFDRIGRDVHIGLHWDWNSTLPTGANLRNVFYAVGGEGPLPEAELLAALERSQRVRAPRWVNLQPLSNAKFNDEQRSADLVRRIVAAKIGKAEAIFATDPFDPAHGLLNPDGSPTDLFLPWRTAALALGGATYLGRLTLPENSSNAVFARGSEMVLFVWRDLPAVESVSLGKDLEVCDIWGRSRPAEVDPATGRHNLPVGPVPVIVRQCAEPLVRWQLAVQFEKGRLSSEYGGHADALIGRNSFPQGVSGTVTLNLPKEWEVEPNHWTIQLAAGEQFRLPVVLSFPPNSSLGVFDASIDFDISADRPYKFTVHRQFRLGLGDIALDVIDRRLPDGRLEIEQRITNNTEPLEILNFNCSLFIPGHKRQRQMVIKLGKGMDYKFYHVPDADAMRGQELWIRAEQINGNRVLNYKFRVGEQ
jgi:hypothetical protein